MRVRKRLFRREHRYISEEFSSGSLTKASRDLPTDKGAWDGNRHGYTFVYDHIIPNLRPKKIVEIGLQRGLPRGLSHAVDRRTSQAPSVDLWRTVFPNAQIIGFDISDFSNLEIKNFTFVQGDSENVNDLHRLAIEANNADLVIDDGSHATAHQLLAMKQLFGVLRPGGIYIIEDLNWQPQDIEDRHDLGFTTAEVLTRINAGICLPSKNIQYMPDWFNCVGNNEIRLYTHSQILYMGLRCKELYWSETLTVAGRLVKAWMRRDNAVKLAVVTKQSSPNRVL